MKKVINLIIILCLLVTLTGFTDAGEQITLLKADKLPENVSIEIIARIELLSGVLSQTDWMDIRGPSGRGNKYFQELKDFFSEYKDHRAIIIAERLIDNGFVYDVPIHFILELSSLPELENTNGYCDYVIKRAGGREILEEFHYALKDLHELSNFTDVFFQKYKQDYKGYLENVSTGFHSKKIISWLQDFFGWDGDEYHLVITPAMFPAGGYGFNLRTVDGKFVVYQIIRERGENGGDPQFPLGVNAEMLSLHEWGHSFIDPTIGNCVDLITEYKLDDFYKPVKQVMSKQAYTTTVSFLNEQILRAVNCLAVEELYDLFSYYNFKNSQIKSSFYLTDFTIEQLRYYQANREKFKDFKDFVPVLFKSFSDNREELLEFN